MAGRTGIRIVVVGDRGTGKSSLIASAANETFPENVPSVLPPTRLPSDYFPDRVPVTIIDTSSSIEHRGKLAEELKRADAVVLTYSCDQPVTLNRLTNFWLQELRQLEVKVPVIVVGCKLDLRDDLHQMNLEEVMSPIMQQYREIETCIECSAATQIQVPDVFYFSQKAVLHPTSPLFDQQLRSMKPRCLSALKRIFILCDRDRDGALNDQELNEFQIKCFNVPLQPDEIVGVKRVVHEQLPSGVNNIGLTLPGFLFLHALFIEKGRIETTWAVLRKFEYDDEIKLRDDLLPVPSRRAPDQSVELSVKSMEFLRTTFSKFDSKKVGALQEVELENLFSTAPESPWLGGPYNDAAERTASGALTLNGFLSKWTLMTLLDPRLSLANLIYIGYTDDPSSALRVTRRRSVDRKKRQTDRNVFNCFVFGPKNAGKTSLLDSFIGRPFSQNYSPTTAERCTTNIVDLGENKKTLILREIPEDRVKKILSQKESLATCGVAVFVYDSSDEQSWKRATELLLEVASEGEASGFGVPCLLIPSKNDLRSYPMALQDSPKVCRDMGIEAPIPVSFKAGELNNVYKRIINAAQRPHLSIPETENGRNRKQYFQLVNRSLAFISVGAAAAVIGLAAYRAYAVRKNSTS